VHVLDRRPALECPDPCSEYIDRRVPHHFGSFAPASSREVLIPRSITGARPRYYTFATIVKTSYREIITRIENGQ